MALGLGCQNHTCEKTICTSLIDPRLLLSNELSDLTANRSIQEEPGPLFGDAWFARNRLVPILSPQIVIAIIPAPRLSALIKITAELNHVVGWNQIHTRTPAHGIEIGRRASKPIAKVRFLRRDVEDSLFEAGSALVLVVSAKAPTPQKPKVALCSDRQT